MAHHHYEVGLGEQRLEIGDLPLASLNIKPHRAEALEYYRRVADFYRLPAYADGASVLQAISQAS